MPESSAPHSHFLRIGDTILNLDHVAHVTCSTPAEGYFSAHVRLSDKGDGVTFNGDEAHYLYDHLKGLADVPPAQLKAEEEAKAKAEAEAKAADDARKLAEATARHESALHVEARQRAAAEVRGKDEGKPAEAPRK